MKQKTKKTTMKYSFLNQIARNILSANFKQREILHQLKRLITKAAYLGRPQYETAARKLFKFFSLNLNEISIDKLPQKVFTVGNAKLPFLNWSNLPGHNCPGAGTCFFWIKKAAGDFGGWCYSFKGWRNAYPFTRQLLSTMLERGPVYRLLIAAELRRILNTRKFKDLAAVPFRLYVDGDFPDVKILRFWMDTLKRFPQIRAYGYSKSLNLFLELDKTGYEWPKNYALNLSGGGIYENTRTAQKVKNLPIYRGEFVPVKVSRQCLENWQKQTLTKADRRELRSKMPHQKVFICPKYCGSCTLIKDNPHACGNRDQFKNIKIILPVH